MQQQTDDIRFFLQKLHYDLILKYRALEQVRDRAKEQGAANAQDLTAAYFLIRQAAVKLLDAATKGMEA